MIPGTCPAANGQASSLPLMRLKPERIAMSEATSSPISFAVDPVTVSEKLLPVEKTHVSIKRLLGSPVEACDNYHSDVVNQPGFHSLIAAADLAYQCHLPLILSPDVLWLTLTQG